VRAASYIWCLLLNAAAFISARALHLARGMCNPSIEMKHLASGFIFHPSDRWYLSAGMTKTINHFLINNSWYLVDLPGYGYAPALMLPLLHECLLFWQLPGVRRALLYQDHLATLCDDCSLCGTRCTS
jgi:hypothetical protein